MSRSLLMASRAMPLWGLLLLALLASLAPRQIGKLAEQALPGVLAELSQRLAVQASLKSYARGWWNAHATILLTHAALRAPIPLEARLRHGPWLGEEGLGWLAASMPWPGQGGIVPFPPQERLELRLKVDLFGGTRLGVWRLTGHTPEKLGELQLESLSPGEAPGRAQKLAPGPESPTADVRDPLMRLIGEMHLPGLLLFTRVGELRLAEADLWLRLKRQDDDLVGLLGLHARRAAFGRGEGAWLIEQPHLELHLAREDRLYLRWAKVQGGQTLGKLDATLRWRDVDWAALRASSIAQSLHVHDPQRLRQQLDRLGLALGRGEMTLERLVLEHPQGLLELQGLLRGRDAPTGLRRLHLELGLGMERPVAVQLLRASRWVDDDAGAERLLSTLEEQHILMVEDGMLRGALTLWDGTLTLSGRAMMLEKVLDAALNSDGMH